MEIFLHFETKSVFSIFFSIFVSRRHSEIILNSFVKLFLKKASNTISALLTTDSDLDEQLPLLSVEESRVASLLELIFGNSVFKSAIATGLNAERLS
jgi:hypothetical protein